MQNGELECELNIFFIVDKLSFKCNINIYILIIVKFVVFCHFKQNAISYISFSMFTLLQIMF